MLWSRLMCLDCGVEFTVGLMTAHIRHLQRIEPEIDRYQIPVIQTDHLPQVLEVSFRRIKTKFQCPFPYFPVSYFKWSDLRNQFKWQH